MEKCTNCGHKIWPTAKFCENCGSSLDLNKPKAETNSDIPMVKTNVAESLIINKATSSVEGGVVESSVGGGVVESSVENGLDDSLIVVYNSDNSVKLQLKRDDIESSVKNTIEKYSVDETNNNKISETGTKDLDTDIKDSDTEIKASDTESKDSDTENKDSSTDKSNANIDGVEYSKNPALAFFLSLLFICLGQFYNGQIFKGIVFVLIVFILFNIFKPIGIILGIIMIIYSAIDAYSNAKAITVNNGNYFYTTWKEC